MTTKQQPHPAKTEQAAKKDRLSVALKANLARRKAVAGAKKDKPCPSS